MSGELKAFIADGLSFTAVLLVLGLAAWGGWCWWRHSHPGPPMTTTEACSTLCDGAVVAWAPDSCVCDVQPGEIVWGTL